MPKTFNESMLAYKKKLLQFQKVFNEQDNTLKVHYRGVNPAINEMAEMMDSLTRGPLTTYMGDLPGYEKSYNQINDMLKSYVYKTQNEKLQGANKELRDLAVELTAEENPAKQIVNAKHVMEDFQASYGTEKMFEDAREQFGRMDGSGHRPSMEELRTMSGYTTDPDTLVDRMLWLNSWYVDKAIAEKTDDKYPDLYEKTLTRLVNEVYNTSPDRQLEIMKRVSYQLTNTRERAHEEYEFLKKGSTKSEAEILMTLSTSPAYRDADRTVHLVGDQFGVSDTGELLTYMENHGKYKKQVDQRPSMDIVDLTYGNLQRKIQKAGLTAKWNKMDKETSMESLTGRGYNESDVRPLLFDAYNTLMEDKRSASDSFKDMQKAMKILTDDDPYNEHKNAEDYLEKLDQAKEKVQHYLDTHAANPYTDKGKERVANARILINVMSQIEDDPLVKQMRQTQASHKKEQELPRLKAQESLRNKMKEELTAMDEKRSDLADPQSFLKMTYARMLFNQAKKNASSPVNPQKEEAEFEKFYRDKSVQSIVTKAASEKGLTTIRAAAEDKTGKVLNQSLGKLKLQATQAKKPKEAVAQKEVQKNL